MWKFLLIPFVGFVVIQHIFTFLYIMGYHKYVYKHRPGECRVINETVFVEDMELLPNGIVLVAGAFIKGSPNHGRIFALDASFSVGDQFEVQISGRTLNSPFYPVGLSSVQDKNSGKIFVFAVCWSQRRDWIEIYEFVEGDGGKVILKYVQHKYDFSMRSISDVLAVGPDQFYFTNEAANKNPTSRLFEHYMMFPWGGVVYCDKETCKKVSNPLFEPSSIHMSPDGTSVFVSLLHGMSITIYTRDPSDNMLIAQAGRAISVGSLVDGIFVDGQGNVWTANYPVANKYHAGQRDRRKISPSQVLHLKFQAGVSPLKSAFEVFEVYSDDGSQLSSSSSVIYRDNKLLIGSKRLGILFCKVQVNL